MGAFEEAKEWLIEVQGMWWPDADAPDLRLAAKAWREFGNDVYDILPKVSKPAESIILNNTGKAIDAFEVFWYRYEAYGKGWLRDLGDAADAIADALDEFADAIDDYKTKLDNVLLTEAVTIAAGIGLAFVTAGAASAAASAATAEILALASTLGVGVSTTVATIGGVTLAGVAFASLESIAVNLAVAQPMKIATGLQPGFDLDEAGKAGRDGALWGAAFGAGGGLATGLASGTKSMARIGNVRWGEGGGGTTLNGTPYKTPITNDLKKLVNPGGGQVNCRACVVSVDRTLAGTPASAMPHIPRGPLSKVEEYFPGRHFRKRSFSALTRDMEAAGDGARGIVYGGDKHGGHVFNVINRDGDVIFLDGQNGHAAHAKNWKNYHFMRTN
ncbi:toxin glutamine deamidase domain-containing protein [Streptomyces boninensis]|uniref:toxin glutamine deamidase domain-containing protein n=1 Tax=Streptomyces boninensis TaxID=2039455 RepID=UPI003B21E50C